MQSNDNTRGILFIMTGMAFFSIQDSLIKFIFEDIALFELYLGRTLIQATILISFFLVIYFLGCYLHLHGIHYLNINKIEF